jgi:hypothetical protein
MVGRVRKVSLSAGLVLLCFSLAACGSASNREQPPSTRHAARSQPAVKSTRSGHLSPTELGQITRSYTILTTPSRREQEELARTRRACDVLNPPQTELLQTLLSECHSLSDFLFAVTDIKHVKRACRGTTGLNQKQCYQGRYDLLAAALRIQIETAEAVNHELRRRGITGPCADTVGTTEGHLEPWRRAHLAALEAATSFRRNDKPTLRRSWAQLQHAFADFNHGAGLVAAIKRVCRPGGRVPAKPAPRTRLPHRHGRPQPRRVVGPLISA